MLMESSLVIGLLALLLLCAAFFDVHKHRIPNYISLSGWILAPFLAATIFGMDGFLSSVYGLLLTLALTFPLYALRWMGAGDVKLMVSVGAFVGSSAALPVLGFIFVCGAIFSLLLHLFKGSLVATFARLRTTVGMTLAMRRPHYVPPADETSQLLIPYAVPIAMGTLAFLFYAHWE